jgi:hypothetical protein
MNLRVPALCAIAAFGISLAFILWPAPYQMALFSFFAQPLFAIVLLLYLRHVWKELRQKGVL